MKPLSYKQNLVKELCVLILLSTITFTTPGIAKDGNESSGGGHCVADGNLIDFYENEGSIPFDPMEVDGVRERLKDLMINVPRFSYLLLTPLNKNWYFETKELEVPQSEIQSLVVIKGIPVAIQNKYDVRISKKWWDDQDEKVKETNKNHLGIIVHEFLRSLVLQGISNDAGLRGLTRILAQEKLPETFELRQQIAHYGFGSYPIADDFKELMIYCKAAQDVIQEHNDYIKSHQSMIDILNENSKIAEINLLRAQYHDFSKEPFHPFPSKSSHEESQKLRDDLFAFGENFFKIQNPEFSGIMGERWRIASHVMLAQLKIDLSHAFFSNERKEIKINALENGQEIIINMITGQ